MLNVREEMDAVEDLEALTEPTKIESASIKAIAKDTVHRICSGQVVLSLAVAVKELVENAIDAGATLVEVKLREQGLESVEVSDNGSGVEEHNLVGMTAKYHTSKLREFVDLQCVETFGFRGEALSSLCALADLCIVTRHKSTEVATKIELDHEGKIKKRLLCARSPGTTVTLSNLFATLPVRKRDFVRNIKKEFNRMCHMLQAYCLVSRGVRIICSNQSAKGVKMVVMQTHGAQELQLNIAAVFGSRQLEDLLPLKSPITNGQLTVDSLRAALRDEAANESMQITPDDVERLNAAQFELEGYVSSCRHGAGRSSKDRQYFYVNSRPCDPKSISKVVNDIYHRYNAQQYPFVYLNVITARSDVDVNLTPDKRQLLLNNEKILLLAIKQALHNTYGNIPSTYKVQNATITSMFNKEVNGAANVDANALKVEPPDPDDSDKTTDLVPISSSQSFIDVLSQWKNTGDTQGKAPRVTMKRKCAGEVEMRTLKLKKIQEYLSRESALDASELSGGTCKSDTEDENEEPKQRSMLNGSVLDVYTLTKESAEYDTLTTGNNLNSSSPKTIQRIDCKVATATPTRLQYIQTSIVDASTADTDIEDGMLVTPTSQSAFTKTIELDNSASDEESAGSEYYSCGFLRTSLAEITLNVKAEELLLQEERSKTKLDRLRFKSEINPSQNKSAEDELQREISKQHFAQMEIIGQFNLGFIIVRLGTDLFIVDQHATDEKYNFEMLQCSTVLQTQPLAVPQQLELTAVNEMVLLDHLAVFEQNGFKFEINESAPVTKKVRLLGKPCSRNWEFGKEDIDELIFMLQDAPEGTMCRPSRIRAMFASRACRMSVMVGKALPRGVMKTLITHMGEIEQPWNCPHGRPTMRHLINLAMLQEDESESSPSTTQI